jgi:diadenosine tetraphosphate (Ap4A) HIT family hydrolase
MGIIAEHINHCSKATHPFLLKNMPSGYAVFNEHQPDAINGCCMLLPSTPVSSLNDLDEHERAQFTSDMLLLGDAITLATGCERVNYLVLCNQAPELHAHCIPRFASEDPGLRRQGPFEAYSFADARSSDAEGRDRELCDAISDALTTLVEQRSQGA